MKALRLAVTALLLAAAVAPIAQETDSFIWLEEVESPDALEWANARSAETVAALSALPVYSSLYDDVLEILTAEDRIAYPSTRGNTVYNYWTDADHPRGYYRRTNLDDYLSGDPAWETVLDVDQLAADEEVPWAWGGMMCRPPEEEQCMVFLRRGGSDASEAREFHLPSASFVEGGFFVPESKSSIAWVDQDSLLIGTDFGEGSMTTSGYARTIRLWQRGTALSAAEMIFEGESTDMAVFAGSLETAAGSLPVVMHRPEFFDGYMYLFRDGELEQVDVPTDADASVIGDQLVVYVRTPWEVGGHTYGTGNVIAMGLEEFLAGERDFTVVVEPGARSTVQGTVPAGDFMLVATLDNVQGQLWKYRHEGGEWSRERVNAPPMGTIFPSDVDLHSNRFFFTYSSFTQPTTLYMHADDGTIHQVQQATARYDADGIEIRQHEATSKDGTKVPYFVVAPADVEMNGANPTLLYAYGGFEIPMTSSYSATRGKAWVERGGVYVVANLRGGGEFGPEWHRAALKENRQRAYDDHQAVAEDLIARGYTSPDHLGVEGGSNGGLLTGVAMTQRPDLYNAVIISVPLLDMKRYNKLLAGASWMAEYGNPDIPEEWAYISRYSPYQNIREDADYPRPFINTTTRDDRVHPGHARKMAAKMFEMGHEVYYFENTEGGHGAGVTPEQTATMLALEYTYLWSQLAGDASR